ncbi:unnamed protein product [Dovyalis caffra]|uniref:Uncharacterized protein n=1 Tax=Dovyalis caffra TaxID=77055 RepID=A0AAV1SBP4_9ROSI|nr:unnamed protein product [Dovyalis caffra]
MEKLPVLLRAASLVICIRETMGEKKRGAASDASVRQRIILLQCKDLTFWNLLDSSNTGLDKSFLFTLPQPQDKAMALKIFECKESEKAYKRGKKEESEVYLVVTKKGNINKEKIQLVVKIDLLEYSSAFPFLLFVSMQIIKKMKADRDPV